MSFLNFGEKVLNLITGYADDMETYECDEAGNVYAEECRELPTKLRKLPTASKCKRKNNAGKKSKKRVSNNKCKSNSSTKSKSGSRSKSGKKGTSRACKKVSRKKTSSKRRGSKQSKKVVTRKRRASSCSRSNKTSNRSWSSKKKSCKTRKSSRVRCRNRLQKICVTDAYCQTDDELCEDEEDDFANCLEEAEEDPCAPPSPIQDIICQLKSMKRCKSYKKRTRRIRSKPSQSTRSSSVNSEDFYRSSVSESTTLEQMLVRGPSSPIRIEYPSKLEPAKIDFSKKSFRKTNTKLSNGVKKASNPGSYNSQNGEMTSSSSVNDVYVDAIDCNDMMANAQQKLSIGNQSENREIDGTINSQKSNSGSSCRNDEHLDYIEDYYY